MPPPPIDVAVALPDLQMPTPTPAPVDPVVAVDAPAETDVADLDTAAGGEAPSVPLVVLDPPPAAAPVVVVLAAPEPVAPWTVVETAVCDRGADGR